MNGLCVEIWRPVHGDPLIDSYLDAASGTHEVAPKTQDWFTWKYLDSPHGPAVLAVALTNEGIVAGTVAFGMLPIRLGSATVKAALSYETFVQPDFQGQGVFRRLLIEAEEEAKRREVSLLFNFPNQNSRPGFAKAGWTDLHGVETWIRPMTVWPSGGIRGVIQSRGMGLVAETETHPDPGPESLFGHGEFRSHLQPLRAESDVAQPLHDEHFFSWRFKNPINAGYDVLTSGKATAIVRKGVRGRLREVQVMDVLGTADVSRSDFVALLRSAKDYSRPDLLSVLVSPGHPLHRYLRVLGFLKVPNRASFYAKSLAGQYFPERSRNWAIISSDIHTW